MPIRLRLTLWYIALLSATLLLFGAALFVIVRYSLYDEVNRTLYNRAADNEESVVFVLENQERRIRGELFPEASVVEFAPFDITGDVYSELRNLDGTLAGKSDNLGERELPLLRESLELARTGRASLVDTVLDGKPIRLYTKPIIYKGRIFGLVQVARDLSAIQMTMKNLLIFGITGIALTSLLALLVGAWLATRALAPVTAVTRAALRVSRAEDLSRRLPAYGAQDEIGQLIEAFNEMLGRLDDVFRDQQRFVADVSHELRTPLTALQGNIDLLRRGAIEEPEARQEALCIIESEVARLNRLVSDLLLLARADGGEKLVRGPVELDTLLLDVFRQGRLLVEASDKPLRLRLGHEDQATIIGDADRLKQLLLNLVDNAIKYTQEGEVVLSLWKDDAAGEVHITVQDTGIGIPAAEVPLLFRRFYRADKARSRQLGGTGLGLAIVQWIVQAHHGTITVESEEGVGSTFTVTFPLPSPDTIAQANKTITGGHRVPRAASLDPAREAR